MKVNSIVEIRQNSRYKYEMDLDSGILILDRVIKLPYPASYGYIVGSLEEDGDALDLFVCSKEPIVQGALITVNIVGAFVCKDDGVYDRKVISYLPDEHSSSQIEYIDYMKIKEFLTNYKENFEVIEYVTQDEAIKIYENSVKVFADDADKNT